jgi:hypothetical protein
MSCSLRKSGIITDPGSSKRCFEDLDNEDFDKKVIQGYSSSSSGYCGGLLPAFSMIFGYFPFPEVPSTAVTFIWWAYPLILVVRLDIFFAKFVNRPAGRAAGGSERGFQAIN